MPIETTLKDWQETKTSVRCLPGIYLQQPASTPFARETRYELTSPAFGKVTFRLEDGKTFSIVAKNNSKKNIYIQRAWLNDKEYNQCFIDHADIAKGGTLTLEMGPEPMKSWGTVTK